MTHLHCNKHKGIPMALVYIEQVEEMSVRQMQQTHEDEIKILNDIDSLPSYKIEEKLQWKSSKTRSMNT